MAGRARLVGVDSIRKALDEGVSLARVLVGEDDRSVDVSALVVAAEAAGIPVSRESAREMRRMSESDEPEAALAVAGPVIPATLDELMESPGLVLVLAGLRYPSNVGFILRAAEVSGAAGVVLETAWKAGEREEALRVSIRADRFLAVLDASAEQAVTSARDAGRRIIAVETSGDALPWTTDFARPACLFLGSETEGLPVAVLETADVTVRVPTRGFIPSYNVQAATSMMLGEYLRQTANARS